MTDVDVLLRASCTWRAPLWPVFCMPPAHLCLLLCLSSVCYFRPCLCLSLHLCLPLVCVCVCVMWCPVVGLQNLCSVSPVGLPSRLSAPGSSPGIPEPIVAATRASIAAASGVRGSVDCVIESVTWSRLSRADATAPAGSGPRSHPAGSNHGAPPSGLKRERGPGGGSGGVPLPVDGNPRMAKVGSS